MSNDTQVAALIYVEISAEEKDRALQAYKTAHAHLGSAGKFDPQFAPDRAWLEGYCYARAVEASARQLAEQPGFVMVERGALHMVVNALRRDAEEGRSVRGEMADMLLTASPTAPQAEQPDYDALEREHMGDFEKKTGIYASPTAPSTEASEPVGERAMSHELIKVAAWLLSPEPRRKLAELEDATHIGHRQFHRAYEGTFETLRLKAMEIRNFVDAARTTPPPAPVLSDADEPLLRHALEGLRIGVREINMLGGARQAVPLHEVIDALRQRLGIEQAIGRASRGAK